MNNETYFNPVEVSRKNRQQTMELIKQGTAKQAEAFALEQARIQAEHKALEQEMRQDVTKDSNTTEINFNDHREMTGAEKDKHMLDLTNAVNILTERLQKLEGGNQ